MLEVVIHKEKEFRRALDRHYVDGDSIVFGVGDNVNLIMGRLRVLFALCVNRVAFQNSVFVERHMSLPRWKGERSSIPLFVMAQSKGERHGTPVMSLGKIRGEMRALPLQGLPSPQL